MGLQDKSDGKGCIGCAVETGKICKDCTHEGDLVIKCKEINAENAKKRQHKTLSVRNKTIMKNWGYGTIPLA